VKLRSSSIDDTFAELQFVLDDDGRWRARVVRGAYTAVYRMLKSAMLRTLRRPWRGGRQ
jgi:hypothetical protein